MSPRFLLILSVFALNSAAAVAQGPSKLADKPMAIMYAKEINEQSVWKYIEGMSKRMGVGNIISKAVQEQVKQKPTSKVQKPVVGQLFYLVQGLIPSMEMISFQSVVDEAEVKILIEARKKMMGDQATIEEGPNGFYKLVSWWESESELQPDQEVKEYNNDSPGFSNKLEVIERDGKRFQKKSGSLTQQYRYYDRFLYSNRAEEFKEVQLPSSQEIFDSMDDNNDVGMRVYADRVPQGLKTLGWSMLNAIVGTQLQRQDDEAEESWQFRRAASDWGLPLVKSLMFDVDYGEGEGHLASGRKPVRGQLTLRPRRNSGFIKQLEDLGSRRSRFAPLLRDDAAASVHVCLALPPEGQETLNAAANWLIAEESANPEVRSAVTNIVGILHDVAASETLEFMVRLVQSPSSGSVILAGLQVGDRSDLLANLERGLRNILGKESDLKMEMAQRHGRPVIRIHLPTDEKMPVRISDIWIAHRDGCLWITAGGEHAHEMIRSAVKRCGDGGRAVRARWLTAKLDLEYWMSWDDKDPTGLATSPKWIDSNEAVSLMTSFMPFGRNGISNPAPLLDKVMASRGSKQAWLTLDGDKSGLAIQAEVGAPLADWFFARQIDSQEKHIEQVQKDQEEAVRKANAEAKSAESTSE